MDNETTTETTPVRELTKAQRRVIGVLVEKGYTTPEYYPLTLKALTSGCNQKSNRSPITQHSEDTVLDTVEELRELGLVGEVHTDGGRAPRYRHYMRQRFSFTEPQLAIVTELLLRGRQQLGELRSRAGRMVTIDSLDSLRTELSGLLAEGFIQTSGDLNRRGIDVDHGFYRDSENKALAHQAEAPSASPAETQPQPAPVPAAAPQEDGIVKDLRETVRRLEEQHDQLSDRLANLESELERMMRQAGL